MVNHILSERLAKSRNTKAGRCYQNSFLAWLYESELTNAHYVEGFAVDRLAVREHGWLELDGEIIDITPSYYDSKHEIAYFPIKRYSRQDIGLGLPSLPLSDYLCEEASQVLLLAQMQAYRNGGIDTSELSTL